ncbi:MAG: hypothetical protein ACPGU5_07340 [Lishizhenia sp.]
MFKRIYKIVFLVCFSSFVRAQDYLPSYSLDTTNRSTLEINGYGLMGATVVQNKMSKKFITGGLLSEQLLSEQLGNHKSVNRIGAIISSEIIYTHPYFFKKRFKNMGWSLKGQQQIVIAANYSQDLFQLIFNGNQDIQNLNFDDFYLNLQHFSKVGFGVFNKKNNSSIHLNIIGAHRYTDVYTRKASYSNSDNNLLNLSLDGALTNSNSNQFINGWGVGIDAAFYSSFGQKRDHFKGLLSIKVDNLGAVRFNETTSINVDTSINYSGFSLAELTNLSDFNQQKLEDTLGVKRDTASLIKSLPTFIQIGKEVDVLDTRSFQSFFGVRLMPILAVIPQVYGGLHWRINKQFNTGAQFLYGGFSHLKVGVYGSFISTNWKLSLGSEDVIGVFSRNGRGTSAVIRAIWRF